MQPAPSALMDPFAGALELLTSQHDAIEGLLDELAASTDPVRRGAAVMELADKLSLHLAAEQELLYPALRGALAADVLREVLVEHTEIKRHLAEVLWVEPDDVRFGAKLTALRRLVDLHEIWQEAELFERATAHLDRAALAALGAQLRAYDADPLATAA